MGVARIDTTALGAGVNVNVAMTGTTLNDGGPNNMTLTANCTGPGGTQGAEDGVCTFNSTGGATDDVTIGGVLTMGASQVAGTYTGTVDVAIYFPISLFCSPAWPWALTWGRSVVLCLAGIYANFIRTSLVESFNIVGDFVGRYP